MDDSSYRCRIGDVIFETRDDADAWVEAGNIGGTYSIISQVFCPDHLDWFDEVYDKTADEHVCEECYRRRREDRAAERRTQLEQEQIHTTELVKLAAWNAGTPIVAYVESVYFREPIDSHLDSPLPTSD